MDATTLRRELVRAWRLVSYECRSVTDGTVHHPMGRSATDLIVYSTDGYVWPSSWRTVCRPSARAT